MQQRVDRMLVIFPFEEAFYRARGVKAEFVGHPLGAMGMPVEAREEYAKQYGLRLKTESSIPDERSIGSALLARKPMEARYGKPAGDA